MFPYDTRPHGLIPGAFALAGLLLGSFLNVCIARLPRHRSIVRPGSACPRCRAPIAAYDNIPLVSYLILRGRCRTCRARISPRYPAVEASLASLFLLCALLLPRVAVAAEGAAFCFFLLGLLVMDLETMRLPDSFTLPGAALGLALAFTPGGGLPGAMAFAASAPFAHPHLGAPLASAIAALGASSLLYGIRAVYLAVRRREGMGLGDVKLAALLGAWLGIAGVALTLFLGIVLAAIYGVVVTRGLRRGSGATARVPLGTFLCAAAMIALFAGEGTLRWYFQFFR